MRPNLIFSRFCKLFSGPFKENILGIGLLFWRPQNNWHFWHFLVSIILKVTCPHPQDGWRHHSDITNKTSDATCPSHGLFGLQISPRECEHFHKVSVWLLTRSFRRTESRLLNVDKVLDFTYGPGPANWLQLPLSVDGCLLSSVWSSKAMIISNPLCLQWTFQFCQLYIIRLPGGDEMMLLGHRALSLLSAQLLQESLNVGV